MCYFCKYNHALDILCTLHCTLQCIMIKIHSDGWAWLVRATPILCKEVKDLRKMAGKAANKLMAIIGDEVGQYSRWYLNP